MKTIKVCIGLFMLAVSPFGCSDDDNTVPDIVIPSAEETGTFLEQDLHLLYLNQEDDLIAEDISSVEEELANDPNNDDLQAQLEELEVTRATNTEQINFLNEQIASIFNQENLLGRVPRLGPLPPPPSPCNCLDPIDLTKLKEVLLAGNAEGFSVTVFTENEEVIAEFGNISDYEDTGLQVISLDEAIDFQGDVIIQITKFFEPAEGVISYFVEGNINL